MGTRIAAAFAALALILPAAGARAAQGEGRESSPPVSIGTFIGDSYRDPGLYDEWAQKVGRSPAVLGSYKTWTIPLIDTEQLGEIWSRYAVPIVTWEPWGEEGGPVFRLKDIAHGKYDSYVHNSALAAAAWGRPLFIRFAHEMNGGWYPWGRGSNGNTAKVYKEAWRHIVRIFEAEGANNVMWVWCPNENSNGRFAFKPYYPGDQWVDWVGLDGFNWSLSPHWQSFGEIFASSYDSIVGMTERPVMIVETGSWETGGSKAEWVSNALDRELPEFTHVRAFLWWSVDDPRGDLRVDSSPAALNAVRASFNSPHYGGTRADVLATPDRLGPAAEVPVPGAGESTAQKVRQELEDDYVWIGLGAFALCVLALTVVLLRGRRRQASRPMPEEDAAPGGGEREPEPATHDAPL
jgi:hypothetical protein